MIDPITILGGKSRSGIPEPVERIDLKMGDVVGFVGANRIRQNQPHRRFSNCSRMPIPKLGAACFSTTNALRWSTRQSGDEPNCTHHLAHHLPFRPASG